VSSHEGPRSSNAISESASASGSEDTPTTPATTPATTPSPDEPTALEDIGVATHSEGPPANGKVLEAPHHSKDVRPFREQARNIHTPQPDRKRNPVEQISEFSEYFRLLEDRIGRLELQRRESAHQAQGRGSAIETVTNNSLTNQVELAPSFMSSQDPGNFVWESSRNTNHLLEVLCYGGETRIPYEHEPDPTSLRIHELRINSIPFATLLEKVAKFSLHENGSIQMRSPFRLLVHNFHHVREQIRKLLVRFSSEPDEQENVPKEKVELPASSGFAVDQVPGATDEELPKEKAYESKEALEHFQALMDFVDRYLGKTMKKYDELQSATPMKAHFEDLWMIFGVGDIIFSPCRRDKTVCIGNTSYNRIRKDDAQAYRIVSVTGGRRLPESRRVKILTQVQPIPPPPPPLPGQRLPPGSITAPIYLQHQEYDEFSPLIIDCYGLDFNGTDYGISGAKFRIDPYEDEIPVNSLEAYPLRFGEEGLQQRLVNRGGKFIQLSEVSHRFYEGLTFGEDREEVSQTLPSQIRGALSWLLTSNRLAVRLSWISPWLIRTEVWNARGSHSQSQRRRTRGRTLRSLRQDAKCLAAGVANS
jgi:hypothetical protein